MRTHCTERGEGEGAGPMPMGASLFFRQSHRKAVASAALLADMWHNAEISHRSCVQKAVGQEQYGWLVEW